jgi:hypothetical protein
MKEVDFGFRRIEAPRGKIVEIDVNKPGSENWKDVVTETKESLQTSTLVNHRFILNYLKDATHKSGFTRPVEARQ